VDGSDDEVDAALAAARAAFDSVRSRADDPAKFKAITRLAEGFRKLSQDTAAERPGIVRRIRDRDKLKLAPLARQLSMSTTRVHQLYKADKKDPENV
jgi:hypothetical protein